MKIYGHYLHGFWFNLWQLLWHEGLLRRRTTFRFYNPTWEFIRVKVLRGYPWPDRCYYFEQPKGMEYPIPPDLEFYQDETQSYTHIRKKVI